MRRAKKHYGFTLIEMIVGVGIFVVVVTIVAGLFLQFSKAQTVTSEKQKALSELSFLVEKIAQEVRVGEIIFEGGLAYDYDSDGMPEFIYSSDGAESPQISEGEAELIVRDPATGIIFAYIFGSDVCDNNVNPGLFKYSLIAGDCEEIILGDEADITFAQFYIEPDSNPYPDSDEDCLTGSFNNYFCICAINSQCYSNQCQSGFCVPSNSQPRVTFIILSQVGRTVVPLQTTVASRFYAR